MVGTERFELSTYGLRVKVFPSKEKEKRKQIKYLASCNGTRIARYSTIIAYTCAYMDRM